MLHHWSKKHVLTIGLDTLCWQSPDNTLQMLPVKIAGKQLLPDLLDLSMQLDLIAEQLQGQAVSVHISQPLMRYQILPWQKDIVRHQDWLALASQRFFNIYGTLAQQWQLQIHLQGFGQPVLAMATDSGLLALIDEQAKKLQWRFKGVLPELLALAFQHRRQIKADDWLLLCHSENYLLLAERQQHRWQAIQIFTTSPISLVNSVEAMLNQRQQSYETLPVLTVWTDSHDALPSHLAGLILKPLGRDTPEQLNNKTISPS